MSILLEGNALINLQQMEVAVNGPDGATHLILCAGIAKLGCVQQETYTFLVGPPLSRRQFVHAIVSGAPATIEYSGVPTSSCVIANLSRIDAEYDHAFGQVIVKADVSSQAPSIQLSICFHVIILAELPKY